MFFSVLFHCRTVSDVLLCLVSLPVSRGWGWNERREASHFFLPLPWPVSAPAIPLGLAGRKPSHTHTHTHNTRREVTERTETTSSTPTPFPQSGGKGGGGGRSSSLLLAEQSCNNQEVEEEEFWQLSKEGGEWIREGPHRGSFVHSLLPIKYSRGAIVRYTYVLAHTQSKRLPNQLLVICNNKYLYIQTKVLQKNKYPPVIVFPFFPAKSGR